MCGKLYHKYCNLKYCIRGNIGESIIWQNKRKHFSGINIGDFDKIISYMGLNLQLRVKINVRVLHHIRLFIIYGCTSGGVDMEAEGHLWNIC